MKEMCVCVEEGREKVLLLLYRRGGASPNLNPPLTC